MPWLSLTEMDPQVISCISTSVAFSLTAACRGTSSSTILKLLVFLASALIRDSKVSVFPPEDDALEDVGGGEISSALISELSFEIAVRIRRLPSNLSSKEGSSVETPLVRVGGAAGRPLRDPATLSSVCVDAFKAPRSLSMRNSAGPGEAPPLAQGEFACDSGEMFLEQLGWRSVGETSPLSGAGVGGGGGGALRRGGFTSLRTTSGQVGEPPWLDGVGDPCCRFLEVFGQPELEL